MELVPLVKPEARKSKICWCIFKINIININLLYIPPALVHFKEVDVENDDRSSFSAGGILRIITALEITHRWVIFFEFAIGEFKNTSQATVPGFQVQLVHPPIIENGG